jgi:hypothetical protein
MDLIASWSATLWFNPLPTWKSDSLNGMVFQLGCDVGVLQITSFQSSDCSNSPSVTDQLEVADCV